MSMRTVFLTATAFSAILPTFAAPAINVPIAKYPGPVKPHSYIVKLKHGVSRDSHIAKLLSRTSDAEVKHKYETVFHGYTVELKGKDLDYVRGSSDVEQIFEDGILEVELDASETPGEVKRGAEHINYRSNAHGNPDDGSNVDIFIFSTGIYTIHDCFRNTGLSSRSWAIGYRDGNDNSGLGTHVACTIAEMARAAHIIPIKIYDGHEGGISDSYVLAAIQFVSRKTAAITAEVAAIPFRASRTSIAYFPFTLPPHRSWERALQGAHAQGIHFTFPAGDQDQDITGLIVHLTAPVVSAVDSRNPNLNSKATFANYGPGVDVWAPGVDIRSASIEDPSATHVRSGTAIASAYVTGLLAAMISKHGIVDPTDLYDALLENAQLNVLGVPPGLNRFASPW